jgi:hypothetical protein
MLSLAYYSLHDQDKQSLIKTITKLRSELNDQRRQLVSISEQQLHEDDDGKIKVIEKFFLCICLRS